MSDDNVIQFPGKDSLEGMQNSQRLAKNVSKGKKVTQQQAFGALLEMRQMVDGVINAVGRLSQAQTGYENILQRIDTNLGVLMSMLIDKDVFTKEDWTEAWAKYVLKPQEDALTKHIDDMKLGSAEDAFFAEVVNMVRSHDWPEREISGKPVSGQQVKDFYIQMLLNPATRRQALTDVRKDLPDVPELNLEELAATDKAKEETVVEESTSSEENRAMPDCKYCGKTDCEFCNSIEESAVIEAEYTKEPEEVCNCDPSTGACSNCPVKAEE
jgi:hypothetical protein